MAALTHHGYGYPPYCCRAFYVQGCDESRSREALCDAALAASGGTSVLELRASSASGHTAMRGGLVYAAIGARATLANLTAVGGRWGASLS